MERISIQKIIPPEKQHERISKDYLPEVRTLLLKNMDSWVKANEKVFEIDSENESLINALLFYFSGHKDFEDLKWGKGEVLRSEPNLNKGIYLAGNVGSGKSLIMDLFRRSIRRDKFRIVSCDKITDMVRKNGVSAMDPFKRAWNKSGNPKKEFRGIRNHYLFDELAGEDKPKIYGDHIDPMYEIISRRDRLYTESGIITHFTTNKSIDEISDIYDQRIKSRICGMCNIMILGGSASSKDRRL